MIGADCNHSIEKTCPDVDGTVAAFRAGDRRTVPATHNGEFKLALEAQTDDGELTSSTMQSGQMTG
jgi:hypothetical protein